MAEENLDEISERLNKENQLMNQAIVLALRTWNGLENSLALLLGIAVNPNQSHLGMALYYRPNATEIRIGLVDEAIWQLLTFSPKGIEILPVWTKLFESINKNKQTRNKIIHGDVSTCAIRGKNHIRLTPPIFDMSYKNSPSKQIKFVDGKPKMQIPGMSPNDVRISASRFAELGVSTSDFRQILFEFHQGHFEQPAFQERFQKLKVHLKMTESQTAVPTLPTQ